jgi:pyridoxamine 5'-phosphate oxidase
MSIADLRKEYTLGGLNETDLEPNPFKQFERWFDDAVAEKRIVEANAMTVATASAGARPSARIVLLKNFGADGFVFYTNYDSQKGLELAENPHAALLFHWAPLERQVRISGMVGKVERRESEAYFRSRPRETQLGAWASRQSTVIESRKVLDKQLEEAQLRYQNEDVALPPYWGGYRVVPQEFEFWQGRKSRLHDRLCYTLQPNGRWLIARLSP